MWKVRSSICRSLHFTFSRKAITDRNAMRCIITFSRQSCNRSFSRLQQQKTCSTIDQDNEQLTASQILAILNENIAKNTYKFPESQILKFSSYLQKCCLPLQYESIVCGINALRNVSASCPESRLVQAFCIKLGSACGNDLNGTELANIIHCMRTVRVSEFFSHSLLQEISTRSDWSNIQFTPSEISTILNSLAGMGKDYSSLSAFIVLLTKKISSCPHPFGSIEVGLCLQALSGLNGERNEVRSVLAALTNKIKKCPEKFSSEDITNCCSAVRNISGDYPEVHKLLQVISDAIDKSTDSISIHALSSIISNFALMNSNNSSVRRLMLVLASKIRASGFKCHLSSAMTTAQMGKIFYGIQNMDCNSEEMRTFISALNGLVEKCDGELSSDIIMEIFSGLRGMSSGYSEVESLLSAISSLIHAKGNDLNLDDKCISAMLYGLQKCSSQNEVVLRLLEFICMKLDSQNHTKFSPQGLSLALFGMQELSSNSAIVKRLVTKMADKIRICDEGFTPFMLQNSFYGMKNLSSKDKCTIDLLQAIREKLSRCNQKFNTTIICVCFYGTRMMESNVPLVREVWNDLYQRTNQIDITSEILLPTHVVHFTAALRLHEGICEELRSLIRWMTWRMQRADKLTLSPDELGSAMQGLESMSSNQIDTRMFLLEFGKLIKSQNKLQFGVTNISKIFNGLRLKSCDNEEVRFFLSALTTIVKKNQECLDGATIQSVLGGLHLCSSKYVEVQKVLSAISDQIARNVDSVTMSTKQITTSIRSLKCMSSETTEVTSLLSVLQKIISRHDCRFSVHDLSTMLYGLHQMKGDQSAVIHLIDTIIDHSRQAIVDPYPHVAWGDCLYGLLNVSDTASPRIHDFFKVVLGQLRVLCRSTNYDSGGLKLRQVCHAVMYAAKSRNSNLNSREVEEAIQKLYVDIQPLVAKHHDVVCSNFLSSNIEKRAADQLKACLSSEIFCDTSAPIKTQQNIMLHSFEADIVCSFPTTHYKLVKDRSNMTPKSSIITVNFEIDGPVHRYPHKQYFHILRDKYLLDVHDVIVQRIAIDGDISVSKKMIKSLVETSLNSVITKIDKS
jgi:hypothetical protein